MSDDSKDAQLQAMTVERDHWRMHAKMMARAADTERNERNVLIAKLEESRREADYLRRQVTELTVQIAALTRTK